MMFIYHLSIPINIDFIFETDVLFTKKEVIEIISNDKEGAELSAIPYSETEVIGSFNYNIEQNPHLIELVGVTDEYGKEVVVI